MTKVHSLNTAFMLKMLPICVYFASFSHFSLCISQRAVKGKTGWAARGRWDPLGNVTEAAFDWLDLKDSLCFWPTAQLGYYVAHLKGLSKSDHMISPE